MDNPLQQLRPDDPLEKIHALARDLAYLAIGGSTSAEFRVGTRGWKGDPRYESEIETPDLALFRTKWWDGDKFMGPGFELLASYDYLTVPELDVYQLKSQAFQLLQKPAEKPSIFISYRRRDSSAFALLIEARLRLAGVDNVFVDKDIKAGETWHERLEEVIKQCRYFICLVGQHTLESRVVAEEIDLAVASGCRIISIWHNGQVMTQTVPQELQKRHAITVTGESAREYETAISELLNTLGYNTY
jgi:TIR domain